jgi:DNA-directed RNA polymerase subunit RPC12/RpoP/molybdopterin converting factor small subunit
MILEVNSVNKVNRTAHCKNCGGVLFKIKPSTGYVIYDCVDCNNEVARVRYDKYETILPTCEECGGNIFKVRITVDEQEDSNEYWEPECISSNCEGSPKNVYVDMDGNLIEKGERESLIMQDSVRSLEEEVNTQKETIEQFEKEVYDLNNEIDEKDSEIYVLNNEIDEKDSEIYVLEKELVTSKRHISELEECISELKWEIRNSE